MKGAALTLAPLPTLADVVGVAPLPTLADVVDETLADVVDETLGDALRLGVARCLWCGEAAVAVVADCLTDQWSRFDFDGDTGVRENRLLGITIPADPEETGDPPDVWYRVKNELRVFLGRPFECPEIAQAYGTWVIVD